MSIAKRVRSIVYAPLFHRGCTFALKHMCTEFYDANHARHGTKSCSCRCCAWRWPRFGRITNFKIMFLILSIRPNIRCRFNRENRCDLNGWSCTFQICLISARLSSFYSLYVTNIQIATRHSTQWRPSLAKEISIPLKNVFDRVLVSSTPPNPSWRDYPKCERLFRLFSSHAQRDFFLLAWTPYEIASRAEKWRQKDRFFRARLSDPRGCTHSCRRSQDAEDAEERSGREEGQWNWNGESGSQNRLA